MEEIDLKVILPFSLGKIILRIDKIVIVSDLFNYLIEEFNELAKYPISRLTCFSKKQSKYLNLDDFFQDDGDEIIITTNNKIVLQIISKNSVFKEIQQEYSINNTIKDIINNIYSCLQIDKNEALINIYYEETLLAEEAIQIKVELKWIQQPRMIPIEYDIIKNVPMCDTHFNYAISQICKFRHQYPQRKLCNLCSHDNHKDIEKAFIIPFEMFAKELNDEILKSQGLKSFKVMIDKQFNILEKGFIDLLESQKRNIMKWIKKYENDISFFQELFEKLQNEPLFAISNQQLEYLIEIINEKKVQKLQQKSKEYLIKTIKRNIIKLINKYKLMEQLKLFILKNLRKIQEQKIVKIIHLSSSLYLSGMNSQYFTQYIKVFGSVDEWIGLSTKDGKVVSVQEYLYELKTKDRIKFGPIHFIINSENDQEVRFLLQFYDLKLDQLLRY